MFLFLSFFIISSLTAQSINWTEIPVDTKKSVKVINVMDNKITYIAENEIRLLVESNDSLIVAFPNKIKEMQMRGQYIIAISDSQVFRYNTESKTLDTVHISRIGSYEFQIVGLINIQEQLTVLFQMRMMDYVVYNPYVGRTFILKLDEVAGVTTDTMVNYNSHVWVQNLFVQENKIVLSGDHIMGFVCSPSSIKMTIDLSQNTVVESEITGRAFLIIKNDQTSYIKTHYYVKDGCSIYGFEKLICTEGSSYRYYIQTDGTTGSVGGGGHWAGGSIFVPGDTTGSDFSPNIGLRIGKEIIFAGPVAYDPDSSNLTSVRLFNPITKKFKNIGEGLQAILSMYYEEIYDGVFTVYLGARGKLYQTIISETSTSVRPHGNQGKVDKKIFQNYPNPFNPTTTINYSIAEPGFVTLKVYNMLGQEVAALVNEELSTGSYNINFNASNLASGTYVYQLRTGNSNLTKKMLFVK